MKQISILLLFIIAFGHQISAQKISQGISGKVIDEKTQVLLPSAHVLLYQLNQYSEVPVLMDITDSSGGFGFTNLEEGFYEIKVRSVGFSEKSLEVELQAGQSLELLIHMLENTLELGTVRVTSLRYSNKERDISVPFQMVHGDKIQVQSAMSAADVIAKEPGLALYRDGAWGTSLSVRGLGENRLVALVNGNRIETATDLAGGLSMVDANELERVEVIKGAASSIYGSGALGGVVNLITKRGHYMEESRIQGEAMGYYEGVNQLIGTHLALESGGKNWYFRAGGGYRNADDIKTPEGILENSQFSDYNYNLSFGVKPFKNHEFNLDYQDFVASNVGIPGGAPLAASATATYLKAERRMASAAYSIHRPEKVLNDIRLKYYNQYIFRDVEMIPNAPSSTVGNKRITAKQIRPKGWHFTNGITFETDWKLAENHTILAGADYWQRRVETSREKYITQEILDDFHMIIKTMELVKGEKPITDSRFSSTGIFLQDQLSILDGKLDIQLGARLDGIQVHNYQALDPVFLSINGIEQDPVPNQRVVFEEQNQFDLSWSLNAGGLYHLNTKNDMAFNVGRSFRSPSLEERFKYIDLGSKVRLGDPELKPEKGWFTNLGYRFWSERLTAKADVFSHYLTDMIVEMPGQFIYNETDTLPALVNSNVDKALLFGFEAQAEYVLFRNFVVRAQSAYVRGMDVLNDANLPLIAPMSSALGFRYQVPGVFHIEWTTTRFEAQNKIALGESATEAYWISDFTLFSVPKKLGLAQFQLFFGVDNLFNAEYVNHLATNRGIIKTEPGRNVFVKLKMTF